MCVYQGFPFGMKLIKSDTIESGRLLFDSNFVQQGINLIIYWLIYQFKSLCQEFIIFCHAARFWYNER